jgi:predicted acylesterase/phospholipase RssA
VAENSATSSDKSVNGTPENLGRPAAPGPALPEAICFTSGPSGVAFGAGVMHAWLASDRAHPLVVAGISAGALSAAAMQRSYRELAHLDAAGGSSPAEREAARWKWYRRYLRELTSDPMDFIWRAFPDPVDFSADQTPVIDFSAGKLAPQEAEARRHFHILTRLGVWLAKLPIRVNSIAHFAVHYVRLKEHYGNWLWNWISIAAATLRIGFGLLWHIVRSPSFFGERPYSDRGKAPEYDGGGFFPYRPLFGWSTWIAALLIALWVCFLIAGTLAAILGYAPVFVRTALWISLALVGAVIVACLVEYSRQAILLALSRHVFRQLDLSTSLLKPYHLHRRLLKLFGDGPDTELVSKDPMDLVMVSANLQDREQYYYEENDSLLEGLLASLAIPGVFPPIHPGKKLELIDGAAIRKNPLPALFSWLEKHSAVAQQLEGSHASSEWRRESAIHVVYAVPIEPYDPAPGKRQEPIDVVEAVSVAMELAQRRDTRQEVRQTNFTSRLEWAGKGARGGAPASQTLYQIFADDIAPPTDISFKNSWEPQPREILRTAACGCQTSLQRIYAKEIAWLAKGGKTIRCASLLDTLAPSRRPFISDAAPGVSEICSACPGTLECAVSSPDEAPPGLVQSFGQLMEDGKVDFTPFAHLEDTRPRIAFIAAGGVFRGAFQIGTIGALLACGIKPQLVMGASVGALMGGALAAISVQPCQKCARRLLRNLASTFLNVSMTVALTSKLKNAAKQLGIRARQIDLSPSELRRMVLAGSRADAGYAAAGAPPPLIDALSNLFLIPHDKTLAIAREFVAGHFSKALNCFLAQVRKETLPSLDIKDAIMGTSLLEDTSEKLIAGSGTNTHISLDRVQPYHQGDTPVSFFATTSCVNRRMSLVLGRDFFTVDPSYDFLKAALSSSAFPAAFAPRTEAELVPGSGRTDLFFADGGMFDNLPFLPAVEILTAVQSSGRSANLQDSREPQPREIDAILDRLQKRTETPDVFIAVGLDADPPIEKQEFDNFIKVKKRASSLKKNGKIESFRRLSVRTHKSLLELVANRRPLEQWLRSLALPDRVRTLKLLDGAVDASILKIVPSDDDHVNRTFGFCHATGMNKETVRKSIADGCFQSLLQLQEQAGKPEFAALRPQAEGLKFELRANASASECGWFTKNGTPLLCPFAQESGEVAAIRTACVKDKVHRKICKAKTTP